MQVFGLWHGGSNYAHPEMEENLEMFDSVDDAITACQNRMNFGHHRAQDFDYLNRDSDRALTPNVDDASEMAIWLADPTDVIDAHPDFLIRIDEETEQYDALPA